MSRDCAHTRQCINPAWLRVYTAKGSEGWPLEDKAGEKEMGYATFGRGLGGLESELQLIKKEIANGTCRGAIMNKIAPETNELEAA